VSSRVAVSALTASIEPGQGADGLVDAHRPTALRLSTRAGIVQLVVVARLRLDCLLRLGRAIGRRVRYGSTESIQAVQAGCGTPGERLCMFSQTAFCLSCGEPYQMHKAQLRFRGGRGGPGSPDIAKRRLPGMHAAPPNPGLIFLSPPNINWVNGNYSAPVINPYMRTPRGEVDTAPGGGGGNKRNVGVSGITVVVGPPPTCSESRGDTMARAR